MTYIRRKRLKAADLDIAKDVEKAEKYKRTH